MYSHISIYCNSSRISPYTCYLTCCAYNRGIFSLNISFNHLVTCRFSDDEGSNGKRGRKKYGTVSQMGSFRVSRARVAISASRGYQSSPIAEKARDSQLLIGFTRNRSRVISASRLSALINCSTSRFHRPDFYSPWSICRWNFLTFRSKLPTLIARKYYNMIHAADEVNIRYLRRNVSIAH